MKLLGLDGQFAALRTGSRGKRLHHAWLLHGPRGVGKASLAKMVAARLLAEASDGARYDDAFELSPDHPTMRLIAAHSHPDYILVQREAWDRDRLIAYDRRRADDPIARNIRIAQIRALMPILSMAPSVATRRVIVIDAADDLEPSAANALLKSLEEPPPNTLFFLVSHAPGRLLPTIRSRCRALAFPRLADAIVEQVLVEQAPSLTPVALARVVELANGSPGAAITAANDDVLGVEGALDELARTGDPKNARRLELAAGLAGKAAVTRYESFLQRAPAYIAKHALERDGEAVAAAIELWERARDLADTAITQSLPAESVVFEVSGCVAALARHSAVAKG